MQHAPRSMASQSYAPPKPVAMVESDPRSWQFHPHYSDREYHEHAEEYEDDRAHDLDSVAGSSVSGVSLRSKLADRRHRRQRRERDRGSSGRISSSSRYEHLSSQDRSLGRRNGKYVLEAVHSSDEEEDRDYSTGDLSVGHAAQAGPLEPDRAMVVLLDQLGLAQHTRRVVGLGCSSLRHLLDLTPSDMQAIGLAPLEARRLAQAIGGLRGDVPSYQLPAQSPMPSSPMYPTSSMGVGPAPPPSVGAPHDSRYMYASAPHPQVGSALGSTVAERQHGSAFAAVMRFAEKMGDDDLLSTARSAHTSSRGF
jgi:hypothetical protein